MTLCVTLRNMTNRNATHDPAELGDLERELLGLVWESGESTADALRVRLAKSLKDSTIRTVLRRLEQKGYIAHTLEQRTFIYRPVETRQTVAARAMKRIADWFCAGSMEDLLVGMIDSDALDEEELEKISRHIERARKANP